MSTLHAPASIKTKKELKTAIDDWNSVSGDATIPPMLNLRFYDPSMFVEKTTWSLRDMMAENQAVFYVTNHPKRSWFAQIHVAKSGKLSVK